MQTFKICIENLERKNMMNQTMNKKASGALKIHILTAPIFVPHFFSMAISQPNSQKFKKIKALCLKPENWKLSNGKKTRPSSQH